MNAAKLGVDVLKDRLFGLETLPVVARVGVGDLHEKFIDASFDDALENFYLRLIQVELHEPLLHLRAWPARPRGFLLRLFSEFPSGTGRKPTEQTKFRPFETQRLSPLVL